MFSYSYGAFEWQLVYFFFFFAVLLVEAEAAADFAFFGVFLPFDNFDAVLPTFFEVFTILAI